MRNMCIGANQNLNHIMALLLSIFKKQNLASIQTTKIEPFRTKAVCRTITKFDRPKFTASVSKKERKSEIIVFLSAATVSELSLAGVRFERHAPEKRFTHIPQTEI